MSIYDAFCHSFFLEHCEFYIFFHSMLFAEDVIVVRTICIMKLVH